MCNIQIKNLNHNKQANGDYIGRRMTGREASALANPFRVTDNKSLYQDIQYVRESLIKEYAHSNGIELREVWAIAAKIAAKAQEIDTNDLTKARGSTLEFYRVWLWELLQRETPAKKLIYSLAEKAKRGEWVTLLCWCKPEPCHGDIVEAAIRWLIESGRV